jgi:hypothetical protein
MVCKYCTYYNEPFATRFFALTRGPLCTAFYLHSNMPSRIHALTDAQAACRSDPGRGTARPV